MAIEAATGQRDHVAVFGTDYDTPDGTGVRDFIHVSDLVAAHSAALDRLRAGGDSLTLNCGYGRGYSVLELLDAVQQVSGQPLDVRARARRAGDIPVMVAAVEKIRATARLGAAPRRPPRDRGPRLQLGAAASASAACRLVSDCRGPRGRRLTLGFLFPAIMTPRSSSALRVSGSTARKEDMMRHAFAFRCSDSDWAWPFRRGACRCRLDRWVQDFWPTAQAAGFAGTYTLPSLGVTPDPERAGESRYQPEFVTPLWEYVDTRVSDKRIATAAKCCPPPPPPRSHRGRYGVDRHVLVAIWGMESSYGAVLDDPKIIRSVVRSLATLAYADPRRGRFGRQQLLAALKILQRGDISVAGLTGSWAGQWATRNSSRPPTRPMRSISTATAGVTSGTPRRTRSPRPRTTSANPAGSPARPGDTR